MEDALTFAEETCQSFTSSSSSPIPPLLRIHLLILSSLTYTYFGNDSAAGERLKLLHEVVDAGGLGDKNATGIIEVRLLFGWPSRS